jgi:hypothetical protein
MELRAEVINKASVVVFRVVLVVGMVLEENIMKIMRSHSETTFSNKTKEAAALEGPPRDILHRSRSKMRLEFLRILANVLLESPSSKHRSQKNSETRIFVTAATSARLGSLSGSGVLQADSLLRPRAAKVGFQPPPRPPQSRRRELDRHHLHGIEGGWNSDRWA